MVDECVKQVYPRKSPSFENRLQKLMDQSVVSVSTGRDKLSTWMLQRPYMCTGINTILFLLQNLSNLMVSHVNLNDLV